MTDAILAHCRSLGWTDEQLAQGRRFLAIKFGPTPAPTNGHRCTRTDRVCWWPSNAACMGAP